MKYFNIIPPWQPTNNRRIDCSEGTTQAVAVASLSTNIQEKEILPIQILKVITVNVALQFDKKNEKKKKRKTTTIFYTIVRLELIAALER